MDDASDISRQFGLSTAASAQEPSVEWLSVVGDPERWRTLGLTVTDDGLVPLVGTSIRLVPSAPPDRGGTVSGDATSGDAPATGIVGWSLSGVPAPRQAGSVDGLATEIVDPTAPTYAEHPLGATGLDHVVVLTPDLLRSSNEIGAATGCELKRVREVGTMRQGFHRIGRGGLIVELVERPDVEPGPARFWGLVLIVDDLDAACDLIGADRISSPKDAVQPGRRIATVRGDAGLGLPLALMSH